MAVSSGMRLGPYEIVGPLGAGGMGEVYRARDARLGREVAIKVLPASLSSDLSRLHRFEQEARAAAALSHPNILAVHDIGQQDGSPYIVSELLDGATLRERLRSGPVPIRKAIEYAQQIAGGLAAAHNKGIVHRDLKPENIFITNDGRVKILDFGLAKLTRPEEFGDGQTLTQALDTDPGSVLGTVGYMSPEQVRGKPADARSDLFSFGAILYEMLSGKRAFHGESPAETMSAIAKEEPPDLAETNRNVSPALERIVRHCLEKSPAERFHSAHDVAFDLETVSSVSSTMTAKAIVPALKRRGAIVLVAVSASVAMALVVGVLVGRALRPGAAAPSYHQLTFRRGTVRGAKFAPDGQVVYSAAWDGNAAEIYATGSGGRSAVTTGIRDADIESVSRSGELLLISNRTTLEAGVRPGTLARAPNGSAPRPILEDVQDADWGPDGNSIAVARYVGQRFHLEFPVGRVLYETATGWITYPRVSPKGDMVAFFEHPYFGDDGGTVSVIDLQGHKHTLTPYWSSEQSLAWSPSGDELWFSANTTGIAQDLFAVNLAGKLRTVLRVPGDVRLMDISRDGRVLIAQGQRRRVVMITASGQKAEQDLAIADWCFPMALSSDGQITLLDEEAEGTESGAYTVYLRKTDGSPPLRLGEGAALDLSRDGKWTLALTLSSPNQLVLLPTGAGEPVQVTHDAITHRNACLLPDGKRVVFAGVESGHQVRIYIQSTDGSAPRPISPEGLAGLVACSPDGQSVAVTGEQTRIVPVNGSEPHAIPGTGRSQFIAGWSADAQELYMYRLGDLPAKLYRVAIATGKRVPVKEIVPSDAAGAGPVGFIRATPDLRTYVYGFTRNLNQLYAVEGLK